MPAWWSSLEAVSLIRTVAQWVVAFGGVVALVFSLRANHLQKVAVDAERVRMQKEIDAARKSADEAAKYEFRPLDAAIRSAVVERLKSVRGRFPDRALALTVTYETWTTAPTREFASELAGVLKDAGFETKGPKFATVYLTGPSFPIEWAYNDEQDKNLIDDIFTELSAIIVPDRKYARRKVFPQGQARIHFGGTTVFNPNGTVSIQ